MGIAEDVVVRVDGFTYLADFVVVNFELDPRVPIILGRPFLRTAKALIDLYEEKLTLRVGNDELVFYADKSEKNKNKQFAHAISIIDFSKDEQFSGSTTIHSDALLPSSSPVKTSDNLLKEFADEFTLPNPFPPGNDDSIFKKDFYLTHLFSDKVECFDPGNDIDEIKVFLAMEVSNYEEGYYDSEGDVLYLKSLLCDDITHNPSPEVNFDHETQNESDHDTSITFSPRNDPFHHEFAGGIIPNPSRITREQEEYLSLMTLFYEISNSYDPVQEEIDLFPGPDDLTPPGVENDDFEDEDNSTFFPENESSILDPSSPRPPPEPPDVCLNFEPNTAMKNDFGKLNEDFNQGEMVLSLNVEDVDSFTFVIWIFLPCLTYPEVSPLLSSTKNEDTIFDPGIST
ncbi:reverse transcriptase domain-containing protein [Tanacetum coccineum]